MIKKLRLYILLFLLANPSLSEAQDNGGLDRIQNLTNLGTNFDVYGSVSNLINIFLSYIGVIFLLIIIWAGLQWMVSGGDEEKVSRAKKSIGSGIIGLIIIVSSYAIANFVIGTLVGQTQSNF